ncbi:MAG: cytochrome b [Sphingomonadales bacterium]|nr:cytochrome b [Sphingomonadales bacterium]
MDNTAALQSTARYSLGAMALHWIIALLIALNYTSAWVAEDMPEPAKLQVMANHKAFGLTVLALSVVRLLWRFTHRPPPLAESLKAWEVALARVVHGLIYTLTIAIPLAGWALHSAATGGKGLTWFKLFAIPGLPLAQDKASAGIFHEMHEVFATLMLALLALHVIAALKHQFLDRDGSMRRMVPWGK